MSGFVARCILLGHLPSNGWYIAFDLNCAEGTQLVPYQAFEIPLPDGTALATIAYEVVGRPDGTVRMRLRAEDRGLDSQTAMRLLEQSPYVSNPRFSTGPNDFAL